jgi:hypothetical protein
MQAYIDDSTEPPIFVLAGFVARAEEWAKLTIRWQSTLDQPPRLEYFKMKEGNALRGQFTGWTAQQRDKRVAEFVGIVKDHVLITIYSVVHQRVYRSVMRGELAKQLDNPYWLMYHSIMMTVGRWEKEVGIAEPVDFIFDEQGRQSDQVESVYSILVQHAPPEIRALFGARPVHRDDKKTLPLQAADLLAWHVRHQYDDAGGGADNAVMRSLMTIPHIADLWPRDRLANFLRGVKSMTRDLGRLMPHEVTQLQQLGPNLVSRHNLQLIGTAEPKSTILMMPFPAIEIGRFLLAHSCPLSDTPHLHRRAGDKCLAGRRSAGQRAVSATRRSE